jgi:pimeloyl-ACP methyl ester carboxylesterase
VADTWILVRGLARESGHWGAFVPALARALPDANVLPLDLPGVGTRLHEPWPGSIGEAMERIRADVPSGRVHLLGLSLGGMIVMEWAARHPDEVAGVVVGASSAGDLAPFWKRMRPRGLAQITLAAMTRDSASRQGRIVRTIINRRELWDETTAEWTRIERERPVTFATVRGQILSASRWRAPKTLEVPSLFLVGRRDNLVHPDCSRQLASRFGARLAEHPDAGHDLTTDACEWVIDELLRFRK